MNFFKKLFEFLFHKDRILTKKIYALGVVFVTVCMVSVLILGANGSSSSLYSHKAIEDQTEIAAENEKEELEQLTADEEELALQNNLETNQVTEEIDYSMYIEKAKYLTSEALNTVKTQKAIKTPMRLEDTDIRLSTSQGVILSPHAGEYTIPTEGVIKVNIPDVITREAIELTDSDYESLLKIVEAEVGTEEFDSRVIIANVIINRMLHSYYPDTIEEVVMENDGKVYQFSPILDGRYFTIEVSEMTREAVELALSGYDNSGGALAFVNRSLTSDKIMQWFDTSLTFVMQYDDVEFFTFEF